MQAQLIDLPSSFMTSHTTLNCTHIDIAYMHHIKPSNRWIPPYKLPDLKIRWFYSSDDHTWTIGEVFNCSSMSWHTFVRTQNRSEVKFHKHFYNSMCGQKICWYISEQCISQVVRQKELLVRINLSLGDRGRALMWQRRFHSNSNVKCFHSQQVKEFWSCHAWITKHLSMSIMLVYDH